MWTYYIPFVFDAGDGPKFGYQTIDHSVKITNGKDVNEIVAHLVKCVNKDSVTIVVPLAFHLLNSPTYPTSWSENE